MHKALAFLGLAVAVLGAAACGGSKQSSATTPPPPPAQSACVPMAAHMAELVREMGQEEEGERDASLDDVARAVERVVAERCQADGWAESVIACVNGADDATVDACLERLTEAQDKAIGAQLEREVAPLLEEDDPGAPFAPPPAPDDPCGGGA